MRLGLPGAIERIGDPQQGVTNRLGVEPLAVELPVSTVLGIHPEVIGEVLAGKPVGPRVKDQAMEVLEIGQRLERPMPAGRVFGIGPARALRPRRALGDPPAQQLDLLIAQPLALRRHPVDFVGRADTPQQLALLRLTGEDHVPTRIRLIEHAGPVIEASAAVSLLGRVALRTVPLQQGTDVAEKIDRFFRDSIPRKQAAAKPAGDGED